MTVVVWGLVRVFWNDLFDVQTSVMLFNVMWASVSILVLLAAIGRRLIGERTIALRPLPVYVLGALSAMWCIERGLEVLA